jgi:hypothetical protein
MRAGTPLRRELLTFGLSVLFALTVLPVCIWLAGKVFLGDYLRDPGDPALARHGGPLALIVDLVKGLAGGSPGHWLVLLGPYLLVMAFRLGRRWV